MGFITAKWLFKKSDLRLESSQEPFGNSVQHLLRNSRPLKLPQHKNVRPVSYTIPEEKIIKTLLAKLKDFPKHIVDEEVAR